jgi:hypothetical protein
MPVLAGFGHQRGLSLMHDLRFFGFPGGTTTLSVAQSGDQKSSTASLPAPVTPDTDIAHFLKNTPVTTDWQGLSATLVRQGNGARWGAGYSPPVYRQILQPTKSHANRIIDEGFSDSTYRPTIVTGGRADVYRIVDGTMTEIRSSAITGGNWARWHTWGQVSSPGFQRKFANFNEKDRPYWIGVAAVDSSNIAGAIGYDTYSPPDNTSGISGDNPNAASFSFTTGGTLPVPTGLTLTANAFGGNLVEVDWDPVPGAIGYVVFIAYEDPTFQETDRYLQLEDDGGPDVLAEDMVILTNRILKPLITMKSPRVFGDGTSSGPLRVSPMRSSLNEDPALQYEYLDWDAQNPKPDAGLGTSYGRVSLAPGVVPQEILRRFWNGGSGQSFYHVADPSKIYEFTTWVRANRPTDITLDLGLQGQGSKIISVTTQWQQITQRLSPTSQAGGTGANKWFVQATPGAETLEVDFAATQVKLLGNDLLEFLPEEASLAVPGMYLRDHALIKDYPSTTDVGALTNPPGESPLTATLESFLQKCGQVGANPWIQLEWYHRLEEWLDILAYICAPVSSGHPMALKRQNNGRTEPWSDAFTGIRWEFGNESWNPLEEFWNPPSSMTDSVTSTSYGQGDIFGLICRRAVLAMQASPYWPTNADGSDKIIWVLGGRSRQVYGTNAARWFDLPCEVGIANYNGGWDEGDTIVQENDPTYQNLLTVVPGSIEDPMDQLVTELVNLAGEPSNGFVYGTTLRPTCYEAGPGYQLNGLNGSSITNAEEITQEVVMKSRAAGTGALNTFLAQASKGFAMANYFTMTSGDVWAARAPEDQGGGVYPSYRLPQIVEAQMGPSAVSDAHRVRDAGITVYNRDGDLIQPDQVFIYGLRSAAMPDRHMIIIGNRSVSQTASITVGTGFLTASQVTVWANTGNLREHNRYAPGTRLNTSGTYDPDPLCVEIDIQPQSVPVPADLSQIVIDDTLGADATGLLPGNCLLIQFDGMV